MWLMLNIKALRCKIKVYIILNHLCKSKDVEPSLCKSLSNCWYIIFLESQDLSLTVTPGKGMKLSQIAKEIEIKLFITHIVLVHFLALHEYTQLNVNIQ